MRDILRSTTVLAWAILFGGQVCFAQVDPWDRVKLIEPGKKVSITLHNGKSVNGIMSAWSPESVTVLRGGGKTVQVPRADIEKVAMNAGMSRGRRAAWGALIGGGVGAVLIGAVCGGTSDCDGSDVAIAAGAALWFGGIAAGIAALFPQHKEVIYTAKPAAPGRTSSTRFGHQGNVWRVCV
jgi:hypothetical protein